MCGTVEKGEEGYRAFELMGWSHAGTAVEAIQVHTHAYTHTCTHIHTHTCTHACVCVCVCVCRCMSVMQPKLMVCKL